MAKIRSPLPTTTTTTKSAKKTSPASRVTTKMEPLVEGSGSGSSSAATFDDFDMTAIMDATGPVVPCVILLADGTTSEQTLDLTPKTRTIQSLIGGEVTFVGQWSEPSVSGVVLIARRGGLSAGLAINAHKLQPPFHAETVHGDIVLMRSGEDGIPVAFTKKEYKAWQKVEVEEFVVESEEEEEGMEDEDEDEESGEEKENMEGDFGSDDESDGEDDMMDFFMGHITEKFEKENGRAPDEAELEAMKGALMEKMGDMGEEEEREEEEELDTIEEEEVEAEEEVKVEAPKKTIAKPKAKAKAKAKPKAKAKAKPITKAKPKAKAKVVLKTALKKSAKGKGKK